jgi:hypothetical protein
MLRSNSGVTIHNPVSSSTHNPYSLVESTAATKAPWKDLTRSKNDQRSDVRRKWLVKTSLVAVHGDPISGLLSSVNNDHGVGDDAMAMATMQGKNSSLSLSWSPSPSRIAGPPRTNPNTPRGAESPICGVSVTEHADAIHAKAGRSRRVQANMNKSTQERAN